MMADNAQRLAEAQAALMRPLLQAVAHHMPSAGLMALRKEVTVLRAAAEKRSTPEAQAMVEACDLALIDLLP